MNKADFDYIAALVKEGSGIVVGADKGYLLESRLLPVANRHGHADLEGLVAAIHKGPRARLVADVIEAMATNETFFFRDAKPFELFRCKFLPDFLHQRAASRALRIWCAACSTGQEPYSLAMMLREEAARLQGWSIQILATDISQSALQRAEAGLYTHFEVQRGLPAQRLVRFFDKQGELWRIKPEVREMVRFRPFNLLHDPRPLGQFDLVFCRNVLIYFDQPTKLRVLQSLATVVERDGILVLGGAETALGIGDAFRPIADHYGAYSLTSRFADRRAI